MRTPTLVDVLLAELDDAALDALADLLVPRLAGRVAAAAPQADGWLDSAGAANYLGISKNALHKLTASRTITFEQEAPGCKCWFRRVELDAWRRGKQVNAAKMQPRASSSSLRAVSGR
jgi:hypothetical protein